MKTDSLESVTLAPRPPRRRLLMILLTVAILIGSLAVWLLWLGSHYDKTPIREAMGEADRLDAGWRLEDIEARRPILADDKNSATIILKAKPLIPRPGPTPRSVQNDGAEATTWGEWIMRLSPEVRLTNEQADDLRDELKKASPALIEARKLIDLPQGRYTVLWGPNPQNAILPCQDARAIAILLRLDATSRAQEGKLDEALSSCRGVLNSARSIGDEPNSISQLVAIASETVSVGAIERVLAQGQPSEQALAAAQRLLEDEAKQPRCLFAMRGERAASHRMMDAVSKGELSLGKTAGSTATGLGARLEAWTEGRMMQQTHPAHLRLLNEVVEIAKLPAEQQALRLQKLSATAANLTVMTRLLLPALQRVLQACQRAQAILRTAVVALALERYRRMHGTWPESLANLVQGGLLSTVPTDPYDGKPLRYRRLGDGVVVYTVGPDGNDDGGKLDRTNPVAPGSDLGFQLWDVAKRSALQRR